MHIKSLFVLCLSGIFLASCNMMMPLTQFDPDLKNNSTTPSSVVIDGISRRIGVPATYTKPVSQPIQKTVTFPNLVKTTNVEEPAPAEIKELETLLKSEGIDLDNLESLDDSGFTTQTFNQRRLFFAQFKVTGRKRLRNYQVKIPKTGQFELKLKEGNRYRILDNDATDGTAVIQMPASTLKTWIHLHRNWRTDSELEIEDPLYYLTDTLSTQRKKWFSRTRWLSLGLRPLPVPLEWGSNHGNDFVLNLTAKNVSSFSMVWLQKNSEPAPPPFGVKEIGPEGGIVNLPGIGRLEIPAGALENRQTIRMEQIREAEAPVSTFLLPDKSRLELDYISPVVSITPHNIKFSEGKSASLTLNIDRNRLGNNSPGIVDYKYSSTLSPTVWEALPRKRPLPDFENYPVDHPFLVDKLGFFSAVIDKTILPNSGGYIVGEEEDFSIQSLPDQQSLNATLKKHGYPLKNNCFVKGFGKVSRTLERKIKSQCEKSFSLYVNYLDAAGARFYPTLDSVNLSGRMNMFYVYPKDVGNATVADLIKRGYSYVYLSPDVQSEAGVLEAMSHEIWHVMQNSGLKQAEIEQLYDYWFYEGPAQYMGALAYKEIRPESAPTSKSEKAYTTSVGLGVGAVTKEPFYLFSNDVAVRDYRLSAFCTYLDNPNTYPHTSGRTIPKLAVEMSSRMLPDGDSTQKLDAFIRRRFANLPNAAPKNLSDHFFNFTRSALTKQRLDLFEKELFVLKDIPQIKSVAIKQENVSKLVESNSNVFEPIELETNLKGLTSRFYRLFVPEQLNSEYQLLVKSNSQKQNNIKATALIYDDIEKDPINSRAYLKHYPYKPSAVLGQTRSGIDLFSEKGIVISEKLGKRHRVVYLLLSNINGASPEQREETEVKVSFFLKNIPFPEKSSSLLDERDSIAVEVRNSDCLNNDCFVYMEGRNNGQNIQGTITSVQNKSVDSNGVPIVQTINVRVANSAKVGGYLYLLENGVQSQKLENAVYVCNMLPEDVEFSTQSNKVPQKLNSCFSK